MTSGTLTSAQYQESDAFNTEGQLTTGPAGGYTYGDSKHPHGVTATGNGYTASYDLAGNMICRALTSATTCSGTQTGQQLGYDPEGRLSTWQDKPNSPGATATYLYDGEGNRVATQTTSGGNTTSITYIGNIEEVQQTTGSSAQVTTYYSAGGQRIGANVGGTFYYFGYDILGSQVLVLNSSGSVAGEQLFGPYGNNRYTYGTLPTSIGFTGQRSDSVTGLYYYVARYYDPVVGQFISPDSVQGNPQGVGPYTYVHGNPETFADPSGHCPWCIIPVAIVGAAVVGAVTGVAALYISSLIDGTQHSTEDYEKAAVGGAIVGEGGLALTFLFSTGPIGWSAVGLALAASGTTNLFAGVVTGLINWAFDGRPSTPAQPSPKAPENDTEHVPVPKAPEKESEKVPVTKAKPKAADIQKGHRASLPRDNGYIYTKHWYNIVESAYQRSGSSESSWLWHTQANWNYTKQLNMARREASLGW